MAGRRRRSMRIRLVATFVGLLLASSGLGGAIAQDTQELSDERARVSSVQLVIDDDGEVWLKVIFYARWADKPPRDLFSFFFFLDVQVDGDYSTIGWQIHDGEENVISDGMAAEDPVAYILQDGYVLIATGLFPDEPFTATVGATFGSWVDEETTQTVIGANEMAADSESADRGDPIELLGPVVFNLVNGEMIVPKTAATTVATTTTVASTTSSSTTTSSSATSTTTEATTTVTTGVVAISTGGSPFWLWPLISILVFGLGLYIWIFVLQWWVPFWAGPYLGRYGKKVTDGLDSSDGEGDKDRDTVKAAEEETGSARYRGTTRYTGTRGYTGTATRSTSGTGDDGTADGPVPLPDRQPTKPDCRPLRIECERLRAGATELQLEATDARARAEQAAADCQSARQRIVQLEAKIADLTAREDAPQRYLRLAEAQIDLRGAQAKEAAVCGAVEPVEAAAQAAEAAAAKAQAAAEEACRKAEECEAAAG